MQHAKPQRSAHGGPQREYMNFSVPLRLKTVFEAGMLFTTIPVMEKIKNGDSVVYKDRKGTIYGKPRENKYRGVIYTVRIGDDYIKATASELTLEKEPELAEVRA